MVEEALVDRRSSPLVLTEGRVLRPSRSGPGNRFVSGWKFERRGGEQRIVPVDRSARIEIVQLAGRPRILRLESAIDSQTVRSTLRVKSGNRDLGSFEAAPLIEVPIPGDTALGRVPIDLEFSDPSRVAFSRASLQSSVRRGRVTVEPPDVEQSGWSTVDFVRLVDGDVRLSVVFIPPSEARRDQVFSVRIDRGGGEVETVFEWRRTSKPRPAVHETVDFSVVLDPGLVRIRLVAECRGPSARWKGLRLMSRHSAPEAGVRSAPEPPRVVVLYVLDALRADYVGHLGSSRGATPCIDRLAAEGASFTSHFSIAPNTGPATKSLFTGFGYQRGRALPSPGPVTLAENYSDAGYRTVSISSNPHLAPDYGLTRGFDSVEFLPIGEDHRPGAAQTINDSAERVHRAALGWLDDHHQEQRIFLYLHTLNPHNPYTPPEPFQSLFADGPEAFRVNGRTRTLVEIRNRKVELSPADQERIRDRYTSGLAYNDAELCGFVDELRRRFGEEVLLVITSDHGEELFDHGGVLHGHTLYDELLHVPLVWWWPSKIGPSRVDFPTNTLDVHATLASLVDPDLAIPSEGGESMWDTLIGGDRHMRSGKLQFAVAPGLSWGRMVRSSDWKLILAPGRGQKRGMGNDRGRSDDAEYVFHLAADPMERSNFAGRESLEVEWLRSRLNEWWATWEGRQKNVVEGEVDAATRRRLEELGYVAH
jgi:arylsulfatase A-like enzyme